MAEPKYRLFLFKNNNPPESKRPYFTLKLISDDNADWKELGAFWKAQSGKGYSGFLNEGIELDTSGYVSYEEKQKVREESAEQAEEEYRNIGTED